MDAQIHFDLLPLGYSKRAGTVVGRWHTDSAVRCPEPAQCRRHENSTESSVSPRRALGASERCLDAGSCPRSPW